MATQFDFQGTALRDSKASGLRDRNIYPSGDTWAVKRITARFLRAGFRDYHQTDDTLWLTEHIETTVAAGAFWTGGSWLQQTTFPYTGGEPVFPYTQPGFYTPSQAEFEFSAATQPVDDGAIVIDTPTVYRQEQYYLGATVVTYQR